MVLFDPMGGRKLQLARNAWLKIDPARAKKTWYLRNAPPWAGNKKALSPAQKEICNILAELSHMWAGLPLKDRITRIGDTMYGIKSTKRKPKYKKPYRVPFPEVPFSVPATPPTPGATVPPRKTVSPTAGI